MSDNKEYNFDIENKDIREKFLPFANMNPLLLGKELRKNDDESDFYDDCPIIKEKIYYRSDDEMELFIWFINEFEKGWVGENNINDPIPQRAKEFAKQVANLQIDQDVYIQWENNLLSRHKVRIKYKSFDCRYVLFEYVDSADGNLPEIAGFSQDYSSRSLCIFEE
jgi:hypothetical protein